MSSSIRSAADAHVQLNLENDPDAKLAVIEEMIGYYSKAQQLLEKVSRFALMKERARV